MKICPILLIFELSDYTLRIFRGYDFCIFLILLFLDRYFGVFDSDLRASPPICLVMECPPGKICNDNGLKNTPKPFAAATVKLS